MVPIHLAPENLSKTQALAALAAVAERWKIPRTKRYVLLGVGESTANHWFADLERGALDDRIPLKPTVVERISHIVHIYNGLHRLVNDPYADEWPHRPNRAFGGQKPIHLLLSGRGDAIVDIRRYVDRAVFR
jgi:uncharacterized protein (DUF2384 family)